METQGLSGYRSSVSYLTILVALFSGLLLGFDTGVVVGAIGFISAQFQLTTLQANLVVSAALCGALGSSIISGRMVDTYGRRNLLLGGGIIFCGGTLGSMFAPDMQWMVISRVITGSAIGIFSYATPLYISEIVPAKQRGALVGLVQVFTIVGLILSYLIDYAVASQSFMFGIRIVPALLLSGVLAFAPETPRWLVAQGREEEAQEVLEMIQPAGGREALAEIRENIGVERQEWRLLLQPWLLPVVIVGFGVAALQQLVGIDLFIYYSALIVELLGIKREVVTILAPLGIDLLLFIFTLLNLFLIDSWGRRPLLLLGAIGMSVGLLVLGIVFSREAIAFPLLLWIAGAGLLLYIASFALSFGPTVWLLIAEIFPLRIRGLAMSLATATIWGGNILVIFTLLPLLQLLQPSSIFLLYSSICCCSIFFVYFWVPETKRVSLEHIEMNLRFGKSSRTLGE